MCPFGSCRVCKRRGRGNALETVMRQGRAATTLMTWTRASVRHIAAERVTRAFPPFESMPIERRSLQLGGTAPHKGRPAPVLRTKRRLTSIILSDTAQIHATRKRLTWEDHHPSHRVNPHSNTTQHHPRARSTRLRRITVWAMRSRHSPRWTSSSDLRGVWSIKIRSTSSFSPTRRGRVAATPV